MFVNLSFPGSFSKYSGQYQVHPKQCWYELIKSITGEDYHWLFEHDDKPKSYLAIYLNNSKLYKMNDVMCNNNDTLMLIAATSGG